MIALAPLLAAAGLFGLVVVGAGASWTAGGVCAVVAAVLVVEVVAARGRR